MDRWLEGPDGAHPERVSRVVAEPEAIGEVLEPCADVVVRAAFLGGSPVAGARKTTDRVPIEIQLVQFILAGQVSVRIPPLRCRLVPYLPHNQ